MSKLVLTQDSTKAAYKLIRSYMGFSKPDKLTKFNYIHVSQTMINYFK